MSDTVTTEVPVYAGVAELRRIARELLDAGDVRVIIGWEHARRGARPVFVTEPAETDKLIFDTRCVHNLVTYLNPRRDHVAELGKIGLIVKGCDVKAVAGLLREQQLDRALRFRQPRRRLHRFLLYRHMVIGFVIFLDPRQNF